MKILATTIAALLLTVTGAFGAQENLLLGEWKVDPSTVPASVPYCLSPLSFKATTFTQRDIQGRLTTLSVSYIPAQTKTFPTTVYLVMDGAHSTYVFTSPNTMVLDTFLQCKYMRA
jgi:hypothetical protein